MEQKEEPQDDESVRTPLMRLVCLLLDCEDLGLGDSLYDLLPADDAVTDESVQALQVG